MPVYRKAQMRAAFDFLGKEKTDAILNSVGATTLDEVSPKRLDEMAEAIKAAGVDLKPAAITDDKAALERMAADKFAKPFAENKFMNAAVKTDTIPDALHAMAETAYGKKLEKPDAEA
jgi:hypothetical protein